MMNRHLLLILTAVLLLPFNFNIPNVCAGTYYVDVSRGSDDNPGTSEQPWKTIVKANKSLRSGDTVIIKAGVYRETICPNNSGRPGEFSGL